MRNQITTQSKTNILQEKKNYFRIDNSDWMYATDVIENRNECQCRQFTLFEERVSQLNVFF